MRCDVSLDSVSNAVEPIIFLLERIPESHRIPDPNALGTEDSTDEASLVLDLLAEASYWPRGHGEFIPDDIFDYNCIIYLESWRDDENPAPGLTDEERFNLSVFLGIGGKVILVGPDVAENCQSDTVFWNYLSAELVSGGEPRESGNLRRLNANPAARNEGLNFRYLERSLSDHYVDVVRPGAGAQSLFTDEAGVDRGTFFASREGYRVILQPALFGGMVDAQGTKVELIRRYFEYLGFSTMNSIEVDPVFDVPEHHFVTAWPNPFNQILNIRWEGARQGARLDILDITGRKIGSIRLNAKSGLSSWNADGVPAGSYWLVLPGSLTQPKRISLMK